MIRMSVEAEEVAYVDARRFAVVNTGDTAVDGEGIGGEPGYLRYLTVDTVGASSAAVRWADRYCH